MPYLDQSSCSGKHLPTGQMGQRGVGAMKDWAIAITAGVLVTCLCMWVSFSLVPMLWWVFR